MQLPSITYSLLALVSTACCRALQPHASLNSQSFEIPCLETHASPGLPDSGANNTISFTFHDPATNTSATCAAAFLSSSPRTDRTSCSPDESFGWSFRRFDDVASFELDLSHSYEDPSVGDPPWDYITTFGNTNVSASSDASSGQYACVPGTHADRSCRIPAAEGPILVPITAAIA